MDHLAAGIGDTLIVRHRTHIQPRADIPQCIQCGTHLSRIVCYFYWLADRGSIHSGPGWIFLPCTLPPPRPIRSVYLSTFMEPKKKMVCSATPPLRIPRRNNVGGGAEATSGSNWKSMSHIQLHFVHHFHFLSWPFHYFSAL